MKQPTNLLDELALEEYKGEKPSRVKLLENNEKLVFTAYTKSYFNVVARCIGVILFFFVILFNLDNPVLPFFLLIFMVFYTFVGILDKVEITVYPDSIELNEKGWLMTTKKSIPIQNVQYIRKGELKISKSVGRMGANSVSALQPVLLIKTIRTLYKIGLDLGPNQVLFMIPVIQNRVLGNYRTLKN
tara:strand:+ start:3801 stop:4361 length:561 start_codon:yes stop_codon:yes gene_type:complete